MVFVLYTLELGMLFRRSYFFIIIDKTMNQTPSSVSATAVINRVFNFWTGHKYCKGFGKWAVHPHQFFSGSSPPHWECLFFKFEGKKVSNQTCTVSKQDKVQNNLFCSILQYLNWKVSASPTSLVKEYFFLPHHTEYHFLP